MDTKTSSTMNILHARTRRGFLRSASIAVVALGMTVTAGCGGEYCEGDQCAALDEVGVGNVKQAVTDIGSKVLIPGPTHGSDTCWVEIVTYNGGYQEVTLCSDGSSTWTTSEWGGGQTVSDSGRGSGNVIVSSGSDSTKGLAPAACTSQDCP